MTLAIGSLLVAQYAVEILLRGATQILRACELFVVQSTARLLRSLLERLNHRRCWCRFGVVVDSRVGIIRCGWRGLLQRAQQTLKVVLMLEPHVIVVVVVEADSCQVTLANNINLRSSFHNRLILARNIPLVSLLNLTLIFSVMPFSLAPRPLPFSHPIFSINFLPNLLSSFDYKTSIRCALTICGCKSKELTVRPVQSIRVNRIFDSSLRFIHDIYLMCELFTSLSLSLLFTSFTHCAP